MTRVLVLTNSVADTSGGSLRAAVNMAEAMAENGIDVTFSAPVAPTQPHRTVDAMDAAVERRLFRAWPAVARFGGAVRQFCWLLRHVTDYHQVQTHSLFSLSTVYAILICRLRRVPIMLWPHGSLDPFDLRKHGRFKRLAGPVTKRLLDRCAAVVFTTPNEESIAFSYGSRTPRQVVPLPVRPLPNSDIDRRQWRERFGVPSDAPLVLFLGRVDYKKGLPLLIEAVSLVSREDVHLVVVGDGPSAEKQIAADAAMRCGLSDRVHMVGWLEGDDRVGAFRAADVFALLSDAENFGLSVIEALSVGCPVLISDQLALSRTLSTAGAAVVVERDARRAADALDALLTDPSAAAAVGARGKEFVVREFSPRSVTERLHRLSSVQVRA